MPDNNQSQENKKRKFVNTTKQSFPIAGIGASAGGLDAIRRLLENLPENTGIAYVVVQHLAANQESMLPEILTRFTKMPVSKVQSGKQIEPNHVYVIPSGTAMTVEDGTLKLKPKSTFHKPIDEFLCSLAQERKTRAIGIVLSGTGTDGTEGLKLVKGEGGITFAQEPKSAQYPDMPKSAISAETVDFVLPPEKIAQELVRIAKHPEIIRQKTEPPPNLRYQKTEKKSKQFSPCSKHHSASISPTTKNQQPIEESPDAWCLTKSKHTANMPHTYERIKTSFKRCSKTS